VPLTRHGKYATFNWLNRDVLEKRNYDLIINTSRGRVVDEKALLDFKKEGHVRDFVLDVWINEPDFCDESAEQAFIATPHIAGYSNQSKWRASCMISEAFCKMFSLPVPDFTFPFGAEEAPIPYIHFTGSEDLSGILRKVHPISEYDTELRKLSGAAAAVKKKNFAKLRTEIPFRHEFTVLTVPEKLIRKHPELQRLGFKSDPEE
ncbi:MAG: NAD(P)-dependent oxidoreductase, partial [Balneolaceae bacterium]